MALETSQGIGVFRVNEELEAFFNLRLKVHRISQEQRRLPIMFRSPSDSTSALRLSDSPWPQVLDYPPFIAIVDVRILFHHLSDSRAFQSIPGSSNQRRWARAIGSFPPATYVWGDPYILWTWGILAIKEFPHSCGVSPLHLGRLCRSPTSSGHSPLDAVNSAARNETIFPRNF